MQLHLVVVTRGIDAEGGAEIDDALVRGKHREPPALLCWHSKETSTMVQLQGALIDKCHVGGSFDDRADAMRKLEFYHAVFEDYP